MKPSFNYFDQNPPKSSSRQFVDYDILAQFIVVLDSIR